MAKYNWTIDNLYEKLNEIKKNLKTETDKDKIILLQQDIITIKSYIEEYNDMINNRYPENRSDNPKLLNSFEAFKLFFEDTSFIIPDYKIFRNETNTNYLHYNEAKRASLSSDDLLTLTHDFYKQLNPYFFSNFYKIFKTRLDHIAFRNFEELLGHTGETISISSTKEQFIEIFRTHTYDDLLTVVHEYSHATSSNLNPLHLSYNKSMYSEIDSMFMELIAMDYFNGQLKDNDFDNLKILKHETYTGMADDVYHINKIYEEEKERDSLIQDNKTLKQIGYDTGILDTHLEIALTSYDTDMIKTYLTSYIYATELYTLYKEDKEKALDILKRIINLKNLSEEAYYHQIEGLGLLINNNTRSYHKEIYELSKNLKRRG